MRKNLFSVFMFIFALIISVKAADIKSITIATGFRDGTYYKMGMDLKDVWQKVGINAYVKESRGAWQNLIDILDDKVDFAITQLDAYALAAAEFEKNTGKKFQNYVKVVSVLHPEEIHILSAGKINSFIELDGANVGCGPKNSGSCITASFLAYAFNIKMNLINASYEDSLKMLEQGKIDALMEAYKTTNKC